MKERHWTSLVLSIQHGQCVLLLGPEIAAEPLTGTQSSITTSAALAQVLSDQLREENQNVTGAGLAAVAQQYEDTKEFGPSALRSEATKFYGTSGYRPSALHRALAGLPFGFVISTCHDNLLAQAFREHDKKPNVYRYHFRGDRKDNSEFPLIMTPQAPLIYHLFGDSREPNSLVLSENDLLDFLIAVISGRPSLPYCLQSGLKQVGQSFLFVGFGIKQWYLRVLLKVLVRALGLHLVGSSFALEPLHDLSEADRQQTVLFYQRGTRIEILDIDLQGFLDELKRRVEAAGGFAPRSERTGPRPRVFISYASEDRELASRIYSSLLQENFEPWLDQEGLRGGDDWNARLEHQLQESDYVLVLHSQALARKRDSYVNKEIAAARNRATYVRGQFLIPLLIDDVPKDEWVEALGPYQQLPLRQTDYSEHVAAVVKVIRRDYQLRFR